MTSRTTSHQPNLPDGELVEEKKIEERLTWQEIGYELGCDSKDAKRQYVKDAFQRPWRSEWLLEYLYVKKEMTASRIADELDCNRATVTKWLRRHDIEIRWPLSGEDHPLWTDGFTGSYGPNWEEQRQKALERDTPCDADEPECQRCGMAGSEHKDEFGQGLAVHHLTPAREFVNDDGVFNHEEANRLENLITVCERCHPVWEKCLPLRIQLTSSD